MTESTLPDNSSRDAGTASAEKSQRSQQQQKREIASRIFSLQNTLRGASGIEPNDFKNYILGFLFYRYLSEDFAAYVDQENGVTDLSSPEAYANLSDDEVMEWAPALIGEKGYFIKPSQLFSNVAAEAPRNDDLNEHMAATFHEIEASSYGSASEEDFRGLFEDVDMNSKAIGATVAARNRLLSELLVKVSELDLGAHNTDVDILGDVYEMLIADYASSAGKRGGEFYTPQEVSQLLVKLTTMDRPADETKQLTVYDPTCGSGSLLLKFMKEQNARVGQYYGQELKHVTYNLARMNFFMHGQPFERFHIGVGDTLMNPHFLDMAGQMDAIVANPPYSVPWEGDSNATLASDPRFTPAGRLAPKGKADLAFVMHMLYMLAPSGTAAIVEFPTVLSRSGAEKDIRKYLVDNDFVDTIIQLPENLFFGTSIATCIIVLKKNKPEDRKGKTFFVDASSLFDKGNKMNVMNEAHLQEITDLVAGRVDVAHKTALVNKSEIVKNEYTLSVNKYVDAQDTREKVDIEEVEREIAEIVARQSATRDAIDDQVKEMKSRIQELHQKVRALCPEGVEYIALGKAMSPCADTVSFDKVEEESFVTTENLIANMGGVRFPAVKPKAGSFKQFLSGDILISNIRPYLRKIWMSDRTGATSGGDVYIVRAADVPGLQHSFLFHCLAGETFFDYVTAHSGGGKMPRGDKKSIRSYHIPVPPAEVQEEIVRLLDPFNALLNDMNSGSMMEIEARRKQYEYYREQLLTFKRKEESSAPESESSATILDQMAST